MSLDPDMKHQENADELVFDEPIFEEQSQTLLEDNTDYNNALPAEEHSTETQWYRRRSVQIGAGVAAVVATAAAIGIARNGDNEPDRKAVTVAQPSTSPTPVPIPSAAETSPTTIPSTTETTPSATTTTEATAPSTAEAPDNSKEESLLTAVPTKDFEKYINESDVAALEEQYPDIEDFISNGTLGLEIAKDVISEKAILNFQRRFNDLYTNKDLELVTGTANYTSPTNMADLAAGGGITPIEVLANAKFNFLKHLEQGYLTGGDDYIDIMSLHPTIRDRFKQSAEDAVAADPDKTDNVYPHDSYPDLDVATLLRAETLAIPAVKGGTKNVTVLAIYTKSTPSQFTGKVSEYVDWYVLANIDQYNDTIEPDAFVAVSFAQKQLSE